MFSQIESLTTNLTGLVTVILIATTFAFLVAVPIIRLLYKLNITRSLEVDFSALISDRKSKAGTPVMGGLIIVVTVLVINLAINLNGSTLVPLAVFMLSAVLGGIDDVLNIYGVARKVRPLTRVNKLIRVHANKFVRLRLILSYPWTLYKNFFFMLGSNPGKGIHAHEKILINSLAGFAVFYWIWEYTGWENPGTIFFPFNFELNLVWWLFLPFIVLTVLVMSNAVNIADGMDGLAAGMLIPSFLTFLIIAVLEGNTSSAVLSGSALGGTIAYLYFNIPPARVQMGDVGSLALGTLLAVIALELSMSFLLIIICFPFIIEFASSLFQGISRRLVGRRILMMAPLHHHFEMKGWSEEKTVMRFWIASYLSAILGLLTYLLFFAQS